VLADVLMARGQPATAAALLDRHLARCGDRPLVRAPVLDALVAARLAAADPFAARRASEELTRLAQEHRHPLVLARAEMAAGRIAAAQSQREVAVAHLDEAHRHFDAAGLVYEAARARRELARVLTATQPEAAAVEATAALAVFDRLGARRDADDATALLRELGIVARPGPRSLGLLTERERDVFALLSAGLSNPEIAQRLYISRKTAAHHVSRVLAKLGLRNRTEVAAFAVRNSLVGSRGGGAA
jgi:DNA-binding NarL/FixJ family response regulator